MSLRRRLLLIVVLAAVALGAAALAIYHIVRSTDAARFAALEATLDAATRALGTAFEAGPVSSLHDLDPGALRARSRSVVAPLVDAVAGFCTVEGELLGSSATGKRGEPRPQPLPPDQRDAVMAACRAATPNVPYYVQLAHPHDTVVVAARRWGAAGSSWALLRLPHSDPDAGRWKLDVALLSTATLLLVAVTLSAVLALGGGVRELQASLGRLREDLRAPLAVPRTSEFAGLTAGLRDMAQHLADAQERERALLRDLSHRERLSALGRVVAGVAHEIRNPLAGIKLKLDVLARSKAATERVRDDVRSCLDEVERLDRVVRSLLVVARKSKPEPALLELGPLVDERAHLLRARAVARNVQLRREGNAVASVDPDGIAQVFDNLLTNAIEASPPDSVVVARLAPTEHGVDALFIDRGPGVAEAVRAQLFEPFLTTKAEGTGLGLWLSRSLVEAHGGSLAYERAEGMSVFRVHLPTKEAQR